MNELIDKGFQIGMAQDRDEFTSFALFLEKQNIKNFLEIGTKFGGTMYVFNKLAQSGGVQISLDLPGGIHGGWVLNDHPYLGKVHEKRNEYLENLSPEIFLIAGNSHDSTSLEAVKTKVAELDFLFIDGDHTYEGVKQDYEMYGPLVRPGGIIAFHDINDTPHHRAVNAEACKLWNELKGTKLEFNSHTYYGGIGVLIK